MKIINIFFLFFSFLGLFAQQSENVYVFDQFHRGDERYSGSFGYVAPDGSEFALIGAFTGTAVYAMDISPIKEVGFVAGSGSRWREITVIGNYAFVTTEASMDAGMQVIDLSPLPDSISLITTYTETFTRGHIIQSDIYSDAPYVYINGTTATQGVHILDISDPTNPVEIGLYDPGYYIHDSFIKGDRMYSAGGSEGVLDIVDISDKTNPTLIGQITDISGYVHSSWTTEDDKYLFIAVETDGIPATIWNIEDIDNPEPVNTYTANLESLVHNPYIRGNLAFISHNTEGLRVVDLTDATNPMEVGFYDTWDGESGGFNGLWSAFPFFPSGKIIGGNRHDGLYVWTFEEQPSWFSGIVKDSITGEAIVGANIQLEPLSEHLSSDTLGTFQGGVLAGDYQLTFSADNYLDKSVTIELTPGDSIFLEVELVDQTTKTQNIEKEVPNLNIFPNPWSDWTMIELPIHEKIEKLEIFTAEGEKVKTVFLPSPYISGNSQPIDNQYQMDGFFKLEKENLSTGLYFFVFKNEIGRIVGKGKFIVQ